MLNERELRALSQRHSPCLSKRARICLVDIRESARHLYDICLTKGIFKTLPSPHTDERPSIRE